MGIGAENDLAAAIHDNRIVMSIEAENDIAATVHDNGIVMSVEAENDIATPAHDDGVMVRICPQHSSGRCEAFFEVFDAEFHRYWSLGKIVVKECACAVSISGAVPF
jgi:hypothetical protein